MGGPSFSAKCIIMVELPVAQSEYFLALSGGDPGIHDDKGEERGGL